MASTSNVLHLLRLLEVNSDENNILTTPQILLNLKSNGASPSIDRRTVYALIETLKFHGYDISTYEENKKGYFLRARTFEDCEIRLLIDSVATSKSIPNQQRKDLMQKLKRLSSKSFKCALTMIDFLTESFTQNSELFLNIEIVAEAITNCKQIELSSCNFGVDKKMHPLNQGKRYVINPYKMLIQNQKYYLICNYDNREGLSHLRMDRMTNVTILEGSKAINNKFDLSKYITEHPFMYSGKNVTATLRINRDIIGDILDTFGTAVELSEETSEMVLATITANEMALCYWVIQYGTVCEVLEPEELRLEVAKKVKIIADKYLKQ